MINELNLIVRKLQPYLTNGQTPAAQIQGLTLYIQQLQTDIVNLQANCTAPVSCPRLQNVVPPPPPPNTRPQNQLIEVTPLTPQKLPTNNNIQPPTPIVCYHYEIEDFGLEETKNGWQAIRRIRKIANPNCAPSTYTFRNIYARQHNNKTPLPLSAGGQGNNINPQARGSNNTTNVAITQALTNVAVDTWINLTRLNWDKIKIDTTQITQQLQNFPVGAILPYIPNNTGAPQWPILSTDPIALQNGGFNTLVTNLNALLSAGSTSFTINFLFNTGSVSNGITGNQAQQAANAAYNALINGLLTRGYQGNANTLIRGNIRGVQETTPNQFPSGIRISVTPN